METYTESVTKNRIRVGFLCGLGQRVAPLLLAAADYFVIVFALSIVWYMRKIIFSHFYSMPAFREIDAVYIYVIIPLSYLGFMTYEGLYVKRLPLWKNIELLFKVCFFATCLVMAMIYLTGKADVTSRFFIIVTGILTFPLLAGSRYITKQLLISTGLWQKPVIVVGAGKTAELLERAFSEENNMGYKIVGFIEDRYEKRPITRKYPVLGTFDRAEKIIVNSEVQDVVIAAPGLDHEKMVELVYSLQPHVRNIILIPNLFGIPVTNLELVTFFNQRTILFKIQNNLNRVWNKFVKRCFDLTVGVLISLCAIPVIAVLAVLIKLDSPGPVFYVAKRLGKDGVKFDCYKFRTMKVNADEILHTYLEQNVKARAEWDKYAKIRGNDPRVTDIGRFLRKFSLDELPQIINVLQGNMSLVGPRPYLPSERPRMSYYAETIHRCVPGITGLWQISGRNDLDFDERILLDDWYVRNWSVWLDISLLLKTVRVVLTARGAY